MQKRIGQMISEMEQHLEEARAAQLIVEKWEFLLKNASEDRVKQLMFDMLLDVGYSNEEICKMLKL